MVRIRPEYRPDRLATMGVEGKRTLAKEIFSRATEDDLDAPTRFALLRLARELAVEAGDLDLAMDAVDALDERFDLDAYPLRVAALDKVAQGKDAQKESAAIVRYALFLADCALAKNDPPLARRLFKTALDAARAAKQDKVAERIQARGSLLDASGAIGAIDKELRLTPAQVTLRGPILADDSPFVCRKLEQRKDMVLWYGGNRQTERAVAAALNWLARHQNPDGSWSLGKYNARCTDPTCTGPGRHPGDAGATAMALLPFFAAGQTHDSRGPYQQTIYRGLYWLMRNQKPNGDLSDGSGQMMYSHGLATAALCEAYGMTKDKMVGRCAQQAVKFIESAQHPRTGGWRYTPGDEGDTSVLGWQVAAIKTAQQAGLFVQAKTFEGARQWLRSCSSGANGGRYCYTPGGGPTPTMTAVGTLCQQRLGAKSEDPSVKEGLALLERNPPDNSSRSVYYWYYATQAMHNALGPQWNAWNGRLRRILVESQVKAGCATGSWDPDKPTKDTWGDLGGRLMTTTLSALCLEVYYRYPPLYPERYNPLP